MDRATIDYLDRATPSTQKMQKGSLETELEPPQNPPTGSCPPRTPHDAIEKSHIETRSEKKRKRITMDSSERSDESETDTSPTKKMKWLQEENEPRTRGSEDWRLLSTSSCSKATRKFRPRAFATPPSRDRAPETPKEAVSTQIWPETDVWLQRMEAYHPDRTDNEVVRLDLAGSGFLRLLRTLRVVLLQDSVILRQWFPLHPLWTHPLFNSEEYRGFAARVESSLATPDELTMQKYWPAHDAVAKPRHKAAISEIKTSARNAVFEIVRLISDRLDKMERSFAASLTSPTPPPPPVTPSAAPVWVQQGMTGVWIGSTA